MMMYNQDRPWYVYILRCSHTFLYTGISPDVEKRIEKHRSGAGAKFTRNRNPIELVYIHEYANMREALIAERGMKRKTRKKKEEIIIAFQRDIPDGVPEISTYLTE